MANNKRIKVQAKTLDKALNEAATQLGSQVENLGYEVISQTDGGLFGFLGAKKIEIEAWVKANSKTHESAPSRTSHSRPNRRQEQEVDADEQVVSAEPLSPEETTTLVEDLRSFCAGICQRMAQEPVNVTAELKDSRLVLNIENEYIATQINRNSKIAESMEHILRKKPRYLKRELPFRIFIDVNGLRMQREGELISMARDLSIKVHENQKPIVLNYKSSYDRKIIHMALDQDERVYTKSIGSGTNRKLMILPIKHADQESTHS
jgi:spoIIIJ-associated protein